ncbi:MAG: phenylacetate--CoA ligase family protein [Clostridiales bacterium]|jgi:phenylacetate-coenzyme A ligase PaaK-like adenylate-forming protein|nr:phenylacetate--CoA ligase family protein [Clostridiales bacterium]
MISFVQAYLLTECYKKLSCKARKALQLARLKSLLVHTQKNSPFYASHFKSAGIDFTGANILKSESGFSLSDIPSTNRRELAACFEEWVSDRRIKESGLAAFTNDPGNIGKFYLDKYTVFKTAGTTGAPLAALYDRRALDIFDALYASFKFMRKEDYSPYLRSPRRAAYVFINDGFHMGNGLCYRKNSAQYLMRNTRKTVINAASPTREIVESLNQYQPDVVRSFPTTLELLADECQAGRLRIAPKMITASGEELPAKMRAYLREAFGCYVESSYISTEGGVIASECALQRLHVNDDWVIVEPVDNNGDPVPDGELSDKLLITNLSNFVQPFIRYEVTDRVALHAKEPCPCGNPSPWIEIDGRSDAVVHFDTPSGKIKVAPLLFYSHLIEVDEIKQFQVIVHNGNNIELRLDANDRLAVFKQISEPLRQSLKAIGAEVSIKLSADFPQSDASGKFRHMIMH